jgi:putative phosphotransacetylase
MGVAEKMQKQIPVGVSARHVHLSPSDLDTLFGAGYQLTVKKNLSQPGQFACQERVDLITEKTTLKGVSILGPVRSKTQIEVSLTDAMKLGLQPPVRDSGDIQGSPGITLVGPKGSINLTEGVIAAYRHIHMTPEDAKEFGVSDKEIVQVRCGEQRGLIFDNVLIRVHPQYALEMHLDTDEANAAMCKTGNFATLLK